jgi:hypothetical protein
VTVDPLDPPYRLDPLQTITDVHWVEPRFQAGVGIRNFRNSSFDVSAGNVSDPYWVPHPDHHPPPAPPPNSPFGPEKNPPPGIPLGQNTYGGWFLGCEIYDAVNGEFVGDPASQIVKRNNPQISFNPKTFVAPAQTWAGYLGSPLNESNGGKYIPASTSPLVVNDKTIVGYLDTLEYTATASNQSGSPIEFWQPLAGLGGPFFDYGIPQFGPQDGVQNPYWVGYPGVFIATISDGVFANPKEIMISIDVTISSAPFEYVATVSDQNRTIFELQPPVWYQAKGILDPSINLSNAKNKADPDYLPGFIDYGNVYCVRVKKPSS